jgi:lysine-specific demethylase/histidyl-hydroxylase NO66
LLSPAESLPNGFEDLLDQAAIDELVSERGLRTPFLRVARSGTTLAERTFTASGGVGATIADQVSDDRLTRLFADGSTLVLQALHRTWPPLLKFCQQLATDLGHPVQANAYVTPPQNQGFADHYDVHDVFVLQIEGQKRWVIHGPVLESPLRDQPWTDYRAAVQRRAVEPALLEAVLRPGDCLYLPRGFLHAATALGGISTHLTLGVHVWTRQAIAEGLVGEAIRTLAADPAIRASLPLGVAFGKGEIEADAEGVRSALIEALRSVDVATLEVELHSRARDAQRAAPIGPLAQFRSAARLAEASTLRLREHLAATLDKDRDGRPVLCSRADQVELGAEEAEPVRRLLERGFTRVEDLGVELGRRLVLAGVAVVE